MIEGERKREKEGSNKGGHRYLQEKRGFLPKLQGRQGKFWPGARNIIRAKTHYITPPLRLPYLPTPFNHPIINKIPLYIHPHLKINGIQIIQSEFIIGLFKNAAVNIKCYFAQPVKN